MKNKDLQVAVKSFRRELLKTDKDVIDQLAKLGQKSEKEKQNCLLVARNEEDYFKNEIIIYQTLKKKKRIVQMKKKEKNLIVLLILLDF